MKTLCIFTPTYQRAHLLPRLYDSLVAQTCKDFEWLVVDDGSTDDTASLVKGWIAEKRIDISYVFKTNGGMHTAHNVAYARIENEINTCIDSDDWMPPLAVETIIRRWDTVRGEKDVCGILGLDATPAGDIIGTHLPPNGTRTVLGTLHGKFGMVGDKKVAYRTDVVRSFPPYPEFAGERLVPLGWLYRLIDQKYQLVCFNDVYVIVDYQPGGSSDTVLAQYFQSPRGFRESRDVFIRYAVSLEERLRNIVHYGISSRIIGERRYQLNSPTPLLSLLCTPVVEILYIYLRQKREKTR
jgi:glycosyltransferase involved in cell wall biosynthesis